MYYATSKNNFCVSVYQGFYVVYSKDILKYNLLLIFAFYYPKCTYR